jgi:hypothetical protein
VWTRDRISADDVAGSRAGPRCIKPMVATNSIAAARMPDPCLGSAFPACSMATHPEVGRSEKAHAVPSNEEIKAARAVLTDERITELKQGLVTPESLIKLMLEAVVKVRAEEAPNPLIHRRT